MIRLREKHSGKSAVIILGGASVIKNKFQLNLLDTDKYVVFLEARALTPAFLSFGLNPHYYLMFYPEKCQSNTFQHVIYQSLLAGVDLSGLVRDDLFPEYNYITRNFDKFFELWRPHRGPHKKYRYKPGIFFDNSPFDLLPRLKDMGIITYANAFSKYSDNFSYPNEIYKYDLYRETEKFSLDRYYTPLVDNQQVKLRDYSFINSSAIALFPILSFMGFKKVYFLGMDMSMLGSMEYASCFTFKSLRHYEVFFRKAKAVFNANFQLNRKKFMRPPYEFKSLKDILSYEGMEFINIYEPFRYALPIKGIKNIRFKDFLNR